MTSSKLHSGSHQRYDVIEQIGAGGMAEVFLARDKVLNRKVVIKLIRQGHASNLKRMFFDEARTVARLNHPNIVNIYDFGYDGNEPFMAMEWLEGWDLSAVLKQLSRCGEQLPLGLVLRIIIDGCLGLHAAHTARTDDDKLLELVHRDISPTNLFVTSHGVLKILDFGVAKSKIQRSLTEVGRIKGKLSYMSPEQIHGKPLDCRSDIFSIGIVLHELLTGERLYSGMTPHQTAIAITSWPIQPPSRSDHPIPEPLVAATLRALNGNRQLRFASAKAFADALTELNMEESAGELASFLRTLMGQENDEQPSRHRRATGPIGRVNPVLEPTLNSGVSIGTTVLSQALAIINNIAPLVPFRIARAEQPRNVTSTVATEELQNNPNETAPAGILRFAPLGTLKRKSLLAVVGIATMGFLWWGMMPPEKESPPPGVRALEGEGRTNSEQLHTSVRPHASLREGSPQRSVPAKKIPTEPGTIAKKSGTRKSRTPVRPQKQAPARPRKETPIRPQKEAPARSRKGAPTLRSPKTPKVAQITLQTVPWTDVHIDGRLVGTTPLIGYSMKVGKTRVRLVNPKLGIDTTRVIEVEATKKNKFSIVLTPSPARAGNSSD